jgi:hypothetical protein
MRQFSGEKQGDSMNFVHSVAVIPVDLVVTRYRVFPEDGMVEAWGHVEDYEVCILLTVDEAKTRGLLRLEALAADLRNKK